MPPELELPLWLSLRFSLFSPVFFSAFVVSHKSTSALCDSPATCDRLRRRLLAYAVPYLRSGAGSCLAVLLAADRNSMGLASRDRSATHSATERVTLLATLGFRVQ